MGTLRRYGITLVLALAAILLAAPSAAASHDPAGADDLDDLEDELDDLLGSRASLALSDRETSASAETTYRQDVSLDEDDVLLAIALSNNGFGGIGLHDVADWDVRLTHRIDGSTDVDFDRDDVFSSVALGVGRGSLASDDIFDSSFSRDLDLETSRSFSLDEDDVLLAIALSNNGFGGIGLHDVADIDFDQRLDVDDERNVDLDDEDALLALAFG